MNALSRRSHPIARMVCLGSLALALRVSAQTTVVLGTEHFKEGQILGAGTFNAAVAGQPAPFDAYRGGDLAGPNFDATWTFSYAAPGQVLDATLTFGIYDGDSAVAGNQVALFTAGGVDLTPALNALFESHGGGNGEYNEYSLPLPSSTYAALAGGNATFELRLQSPGGDGLGPTAGNGAGIDFAKISMIVPEPAPVTLAAVGVLGLYLFGRRRH